MHGLHVLVRAGIAVVLVAGISACAAATDTSPPQNVTQVPTVDDSPALPTATPAQTKVGEMTGDGPYQRFIVKYRDGSAAAESSAAASKHLEASDLDAIAAGEPLQLEWQLRMGVGADVFTTSRPLDRQEAADLMSQLGADPQVEYIEIDGIATIQQGSDVPPPQPLGGN